jgi:hypothetical protein
MFYPMHFGNDDFVFLNGFENDKRYKLIYINV